MRFLLILFLMFTANAHAGTVTTDDYASGDVVTANNLNSRFNALKNEMNGALDNNNADTSDGFRFVEILGADITPGTDGRMFYNQTANQMKIDNGSTLDTLAFMNQDNVFSGDNSFTSTVSFDGTASGNFSSIDIDGGTIDSTTIGSASWSTSKFTSITLPETSGPTTAASEGALYVKEVSGSSELFYREESDGTEIQMTNGGSAAGGATYTTVSPTLQEGSTYATEQATTSASYDKLKELSPLTRSGSIKVEWEHKEDPGGGTAYTVVYVGGTVHPSATERSTASGVYAVTSDTLTFSTGDVIQIYGKNAGAAGAKVQNMKLYVDNPTLPIEVE